jgi:sugar lactone lactonase YvrE
MLPIILSCLDFASDIPVASYYVAGDGEIYAFAEDGTTAWSFSTGGPTSPTVANIKDGDIYFAYDNGGLRKVSPDGGTLWTANGAIPASMATDKNGNIYTTGTTTKKYNSSGTLLWSVSDFEGQSIAIDPLGNVFVKGQTQSGKELFKYNSSGVFQWSVTLKDPSVFKDDLIKAIGIATDSEGNVYVPAQTPDGARSNLFIRKISPSGSILQDVFLFQTSPFVIGEGPFFLFSVDTSNNLYAFIFINNAADIGPVKEIRKYSSAGSLLSSISSPDRGVGSMALDLDGNLYCTTAVMDGSTPLGTNFSVIKYNSSLVQQWSRETNMGIYPNTFVSQITLKNGVLPWAGPNIEYYYSAINFSTGATELSAYDPTGISIWTKPSLSVRQVAVDRDGNLLAVSETSTNNIRNFDPAGTELWVRSHGTFVEGVASDKDGNVCITGGRTSNITTRKYNSAGTLLWSADMGTTSRGIAVDPAGNVYVNAVSVRKFNSAGATQWTVSPGFPGRTRGIAVDASGNVYVCGQVTNTNPAIGVVVRKYSTAGALLLSFGLSGATSGQVYNVDRIAVDASGNIYIGGSPIFSPGLYNTSFRKFDAAGNQLWAIDFTTSELMALYLDQNSEFLYAGFSRVAGNLTSAKIRCSDGAIMWTRNVIPGNNYSSITPKSALLPLP